MSTPVMTDPPREEASASSAVQRMHAPQLPRWTPWAVLAAGVAVALLLHFVVGSNLALSVVAGWFTFVVILGGVSFFAEGRRKSVDRLATALVTTAFGLALIPLGTLLWQVVSNGAPALNSTFLTSPCATSSVRAVASTTPSGAPCW